MNTSKIITPVSTFVTVSPNAFSYVRNVKSAPAGKAFETLMLLLQGEKVSATVYQPIVNVVGHTSINQLTDCYAKLDSESKRLWCTEKDFEVVVEKFGRVRLGFNLSGILSK